MAANASKSVFAWVTMTCTQQRLDRRPANPVLSGDVTLDGRDEHGLQSTIHCLRGSMDSRQKTYSKPRVFLAALAVALVTIAPAASAPSAPRSQARRPVRRFRSSRSSRGIPLQRGRQVQLRPRRRLLFNSPVYRCWDEEHPRHPRQDGAERLVLVARAGGGRERQYIGLVGVALDREALGRLPDAHFARRRPPRSRSRPSRSSSAGIRYPGRRSTASRSRATRSQLTRDLRQAIRSSSRRPISLPPFFFPRIRTTGR